MELVVLPRFRRPGLRASTSDVLRQRLAAVVTSATLSVLDPERIQALGEDLRVAQRMRDHHLGLLVCSLVLSALQRSTDTQGRWLDAQSTYESLGGKRTGTTSFREQVQKSVPVLRKMLDRRMRQLRTETPALAGRLKDLQDVLIPDGCAFKLAKALAGCYRGTSQAAELKLHALFSVRANGAVEVTSTAGRVHDNDGFKPTKETWVKGALYIWDLGYDDYERVVDAVEAGSQVLQRLKTSANPVVLASYGPTGKPREMAWEDGRPIRLNAALQLGLEHHQRVLDLDVCLRDVKKRKVVARVVCVPFEGEDRYYLTTLRREIFSPQDVAELYRVRWEVELLFRNWRGAVRLDEVRRLRNPNSLNAAVLSSLLAATLGQAITRDLNRLCAELAKPTPAEPGVAMPVAMGASSREAFPPGALA